MKNEENRSTSNFSIDHILNRAGQNTCPIKCNENLKQQNNSANETSINYSQMKMQYEGKSFHNYTFQWLNCTRYHPPKLSRNNKIKKSPFKKESVKRQPGRHPRIPFSAVQIETLEKSYKNSQYLCPDEILKLSRQLDLSDTRIKIWFQNRRAREKREKDSNLQFSQREDSNIPNT